MQEISTERRDSVLEEHDYIGLSEASPAAKMSTTVTDAERAREESELRLELGLGLGLGTGFARKSSNVEPEPSRTSSFSEVAMGTGSAAPRNGMKRGYTEVLASITRLKNAEADTNILQQQQQQQQQQKSPFMPTWAPSKPTIPAWNSEKPVNLTPPKVQSGKFEPFGPWENTQHPDADDVPPSKGQVVGWPPVRAYRRQTLAKPSELFVKVNMDGITVGRKVDLNAYTSYESLLFALEEMFQPSSNNAQGSSQASSARENEMKHFLLSSDSEFVLTYEDKDGDWMLVGDVPWNMFVSTVKRLRITRGVEASGSGTRGLEKLRFHLRG